MAHIDANELRARFGGTKLTLLDQYRLDKLRRERETRRQTAFSEAPVPRVAWRCAWCPPTPEPLTMPHVVLTHGMCETCKARIEKEG